MAETHYNLPPEKEGIFDIPPLEYFAQDNYHSGSAHDFFRYKISPTKEHVFKCTVWHGVNSLRYTPQEEIKAVTEFPMTEDGIAQIQPWLEEKYAEFTAEHPEKLIDVYAERRRIIKEKYGNKKRRKTE